MVSYTWVCWYSWHMCSNGIRNKMSCKQSLKKFYKKLGIKAIRIKSYGMSVWAWTLTECVKIRFRREKLLIPDAEKIENTTIKDAQIGLKHKIVAKVYEYLCIPGMGRNLEIWGIKK